MESEEIPLSLRYRRLSLTYWVRLQGSVNNPATSVLHDCWEYLKKSNGFGWNIDDAAGQYGLKDLKYSPALAMSSVPPWILPVPEVNIEKKRKIIQISKALQ